MKRTGKKSLTEAARIHEATERASTEMASFIDFIQYYNPDIDRATATLTAAYYLHELPVLLVIDPEIMQELGAIASRLSQS